MKGSDNTREEENGKEREEGRGEKVAKCGKKNKLGGTVRWNCRRSVWQVTDQFGGRSSYTV